MFDWKSEQRPIVALAPMADMTDSAFCRIAKRLGCRIVFREMVSAEAIVRASDKTLQMAAFDEEERPIIQQLFGADPQVMSAAARLIDERYSPDGFDINMGCPACKIVSTFNGASLLRNPKLAADIVRSVKASTKKPVSAKMRLGWSEPDEILEFVKYIEDAGADLITIHGRTKKQGYAGQANWEMIGRAKQLVSIPVLANGDINSPTAAIQAMRITGCDGMLIARGSLGNPWLFKEIAEALQNSDRMIATNDIAVQDLPEVKRVVRDHAQLHAELYGGERPLVTFRKHLVYYFRGFFGAKNLREKLVQVETLEDLNTVLSEL
ncbi:MAG: tRNA dihydrouridine synthase DusB [Patescibacteria group bacterium]